MTCDFAGTLAASCLHHLAGVQQRGQSIWRRGVSVCQVITLVVHVRKTPSAFQLLKPTGTLQHHISATPLFLIDKSGLMLLNQEMMNEWDEMRQTEEWMDGSTHSYPAFQLPPWEWILELAWLHCPSLWAAALPTESPAPCPTPGRCCRKESCCCLNRSGSSLQTQTTWDKRQRVNNKCQIAAEMISLLIQQQKTDLQRHLKSFFKLEYKYYLLIVRICLFS